MTSSWISKGIFFGAGLIAGAAGFAFSPFTTGENTAAPAVRELHLGQSDWINPLLDCPAASTKLPPKHAEIEESVQKVINAAKQRGDITEASIYFRDLNGGPTFGIKSGELFSSASLLKVPLMIGYFKKMETDPGLFSKKIVYHPEEHDITRVQQTIEPPDALKAGKAYPVDELISRMIVQSDNTAASMLLVSDPEVNVVSVLRDMGILLKLQDGDAWISVASYASIFRMLYNATYLNRSYSRGALQLLSQSRMDSGLAAGIAPGIQISNKFGERVTENLIQFHDCGIIYLPERPYILCVMSRGQKEMPLLVRNVAEISKVVFEQMSKP